MFSSRHAFLSCLSSLPIASLEYQNFALERQGRLTKPAGSLGRLEEISVWLSGWQEQERLSVERVKLLLFAGNHGVMKENVSAFPPEVTKQMVANFQQGGAAINALTQVFGHELQIFPLDLEQPTENFTKQAAMTEEEVLAAINIGAGAVDELEVDLLYLGEMGIGNTTCAAAIAAAIFGGSGVDWAGPGTGLTYSEVRRKAEVIDKGLLRHSSNFDTAFDVIRCLGGRELAAMMGAVVAARLRRVPVLLDGFVVTAAAVPLVLHGFDTLDHCMVAHCSAEPAHQRMLEHLWMEPLLDLNMRLGEGTGAALAAEIVKGAVATYNQMATFDEAAVSGKVTSTKDKET